MNSQHHVPIGYEGREQALIKHLLLKSYLERLLLIIGMGGRRSGRVELCYVDCFAGPWGDESDDLANTSIAISLRTMEKCRRALVGQSVNVTMRALFIERDDEAFGRLEDFLARPREDAVRAACMHGDFVDLRPQILDWCGRDAFTFFFIDPKGWKDVALPKLVPLLARPRSEFLINFMYDFINRTASMRSMQREIAELLGVGVDSLKELKELSPQEREVKLVHDYRSGLKSACGHRTSKERPRTVHVRVLDPEKDRAKYHLVYMTAHPKGIVTFMEISEKLEQIQRGVRAAKRFARRQERSGTADLFSHESYVEALPATEIDPDEVDAFWLQYLAVPPDRVAVEQMADLLEDTGWMPGDLQKALKRLIDDGEVQNLDAIKKRTRKPLHYEGQGERLRLLPLAERSPS